MRNYEGFRVDSEDKNAEYQNNKRKTRENKKLVIEDNTIYEIDLDCYDCLVKESKA